MGSFGGLEWIVIGLAVLLLFGAKRIPELARGLGQGIKEFRKASDDIKREIEEGHPEPAPRKESKSPESTTHQSKAADTTESVKNEDNLHA